MAWLKIHQQPGMHYLHLKIILSRVLVTVAIIFFYAPVMLAQLTDSRHLLVKKCRDFEITGRGDNPEWKKTDWNEMPAADTIGTVHDASKFKILYSAKGVYVLFYGADKKITTTYDQDFGELYKGDVFEVFFHTDTKAPVYLEYEVNQLNRELVLLIPNFNGRYYGWTPFHYENERRVKKKVVVDGGEPRSNANIKGWSAELFFPYDLFKPLGNVPPATGTIWTANFCRLDYDQRARLKWSWSPVLKTFHEPERFLQMQFE